VLVAKENSNHQVVTQLLKVSRYGLNLEFHSKDYLLRFAYFTYAHARKAPLTPVPFLLRAENS
jgi:hypothetical protein